MRAKTISFGYKHNYSNPDNSMSQQQENYSQSSDGLTALVFDENWAKIAAESEADVPEIGAGLDWGLALGYLMRNPTLFGRVTQLRVSLNREARLLLEEWNLGAARKSATACARARILEKLLNPSRLVTRNYHHLFKPRRTISLRIYPRPSSAA